MSELVILTGANGHLGRTIARQLTEEGKSVRGLVLPGEDTGFLKEIGVETVFGDVRDVESLRVLFAEIDGRRLIVIHAAGIIDITSHVLPQMRAVNVDGTKNMAELSLEYHADRFIYISSVHAIPEKPNREQILETKIFSEDNVSGGYAKTKAEAAAYVMECVEKRGLPAIILHPSGIIGPGDNGNNHVVAVIKAYIEKRLPASIWAGYNLVDVRDVAQAVVAAIDKGRLGETYILSGHHGKLPNIFRAVNLITGDGPRICPVVPIWLAALVVPMMEKKVLREGKRPLFTKYALETLGSNDNFSYAKAGRELGFCPRSIFESIEGTVAWLERARIDSAG